MKILHIGYAVKDIDIAINGFADLGYVPDDTVFFDETRKIKICFLKNEEYVVELVAPLGDNSPVDGFLKKSGNTPYHFCYECKDTIEEECEKLRKQGYILVGTPQPAIAFENKKTAFLFHKNIGLIEIVEK